MTNTAQNKHAGNSARVISPDQTDGMNSQGGASGERVVEYPVALARYVGAFFDELARGGVRAVVVSPGSRSTPLSMMAYASDLDVYVDVDERGAAFFALGLAKATGQAVAVICTSGTAVANYYPAVLEAESSRVPLLVLSGDRPARLQQVGAPQTCDQLNIFGAHVRSFWNMPGPSDAAGTVRYARQVARDALAALSPKTLMSAPVHINFPFDEPLTPAYAEDGVFAAERAEASSELPLMIEGGCMLEPDQATQLTELLQAKRAIALCGEGTLGVFDAQDPACWELRNERAQALLEWAYRFDVPLLADPLSQLRNFSDATIIDNYDNIFGREACPDFDVVVRFGRYPVSKRVFKTLETKPHIQIVVDPSESRDFNAVTTTLVRCDPLCFVKSMLAVTEEREPSVASAASDEVPRESSSVASRETAPADSSFIEAWAAANDAEADLINSVEDASFVYTCTREGCFNQEIALEGAYVQALIDHAAPRSLIFSANSMAIRALDTFYVKPSAATSDVVQLGAARKERTDQLTILANRGLNGIDGTFSSALGAAQAYEQAYFLTGDLTLLHDLNAFSLQHEFELRAAAGKPMPSVIVILFNNKGGGIFDMLPQKSSDPYFERLFLTPQNVDFEACGKLFGLLYKKATGLDDFRATLDSWSGTPGVHLLEVDFSLEGLAGRFRQFQ